MVTRKKTKLENFFSIKKYIRRIGASNIFSSNNEFEKLKHSIIDAGEFCYTHGSCDNLNNHIENLKKEFHGKSELEFYHAKLNVLLRRNYNVNETYKKFKALWVKEHEYLIKELNTRWLISAADSFLDHDEDDLCKAYAFSCLCLINTCKLYETERFLEDVNGSNYLENRLLKIKDDRISLFDGTSAFKIGTCDTLRNMMWRFLSLKKEALSYKILKELLKRVNNLDTVYNRFTKYHTNNNTIWW